MPCMATVGNDVLSRWEEILDIERLPEWGGSLHIDSRTEQMGDRGLSEIAALKARQ